MQVKEIQEKLSQQETLDTIININLYLSFVQKKIMCDTIVKASLDKNENDLYICDFYNRKLTTDISLIANYTDIEMGENFIEDYDILCECGVVDYIYKVINQEDTSFIEEMVSRNIEQLIRINNSIEGVLSSKLEKLIQKIPDEKGIKSIIKEAKKQINGLKPENLEILKNVVSKQGDLN